MFGVMNMAMNSVLMRNPRMQEYLDANPNSAFASLMGVRRNPQPRVQGVSDPNGMRERWGEVGGLAEQAMSNPNMRNGTGLGIPSFAAGGMVAPMGGAVRPGAGMVPEGDPQFGASAPPAMSETQIEQEAQRFAQANPQAMQQIQAVLSHAMQTGELTTAELNTAVQMAKLALANPASYPQLRQYAIQNGLGTEADLPQQMDKGLLFTLLIAGKALQANPSTGAPQGNAMQGQKPAGALPEYSDGGMTGDKEHLAVVHPREYVIPEDALIYHGKKHFDKLIEQAREPKDGSQ